tara:strand:- start:733 stop:966 length:234 start_codon:yes stop_codon:yes gene_type:complete
MTAVLELLTGLEPVASSLPRKCSTTELQQQAPLSALMARKEKAFSLTRKLGSDVESLWSGRWESNPRVQLGRLSFYH